MPFTYLFSLVSEKVTLSQEHFIKVVTNILQEKPPAMNPPSFIFKRCHLAAPHNAKILYEANFDLDKVIRAQHPSQLSYGSELLWDRLKDILNNGATFPLQLIRAENLQLDLAYHKERGSHKSLSKYSSFIDPVISEDIEHGFALPLPIEMPHYMKNASIAPLGCQKQTTIRETGQVIPKYRLIHDQSFPGPSGSSVNLRVQKNLLSLIMYSFVP